MRSPKRPRARHVSRTTPSEYPGKVTIGMLSDELLLDVFHYYLDASPRYWPRLVHICRKWRHIVFASQRALRLRLFCTHGMPVAKTLYCWPALPIVVEYGGSPAPYPPTLEDEDNMLAALKQSDRVSSIRLTVTASLLAKLSPIEVPFSKLEDLVLLYQDSMKPRLSRPFRWDPGLCGLRTTGTGFPGPLQQLSSMDLVDIQFHNMVKATYLLPETLVDTLSQMTQLRSLSLHFLPTASFIGIPSPAYEEPVNLPSLTRLNFRGIAEFLEGLVVSIYAPCLRDIEITFFDEVIFDVPKLSKFIDQIEMQNSHRQADILFSEDSASISLTQPTLTCLKLQLLCKSLTQQLFSVAQICNRLSTFMCFVEDLRIKGTRLLSRQDNVGCERWAKLTHSFRGAKSLHIAGSQPGPHYVPLREAVVSLMVSRRLSGSLIDVEYERLWIDEPDGTGHFSQKMTIETLSDDVLLNIFRYYQDSSPQFWSTLTHVCRRWRQVVLTSPLGLDFRLYCTYGTPVLKTLDYWPPFPLVLNYGGSPVLDPPAPEDEENIMAALKQSDRVGSISLTVTNSLLENLSTISEPFSELEELVLLSQYNVQLTLPSNFRWGPRLRTLQSTGIAFPSFPQLLSPSTGLVDLQLHEIPNVGYFLPDAFANALSEVTQLRTLSLHFLSLPPRRSYLGLPPQSGERVVLPALTCLKYRGTCKYLDSFVARIDAPSLRDVDITLFSQPTMDASQLGRFIERIGIQTSLSQADIKASVDAISISFTNSSLSTPLQLQISCKQLDWQLSSIAQILNHFSHFLLLVENIGINTTELPSGLEVVGGEQWPELIRAFTSAKDFRVAGTHVADILHALRPADGGHTTDTIVLPTLRNLHVQFPMPIIGPSWDTTWAFMTSRQLSGSPVNVYVVSFQCHICHTKFTEAQELETHIVGKHAYQIVCSYCSDFEWSMGGDHLFREHLESKHPKVDALISKPFLTPFHLDSLVNRHSSLRAPDIVAPSPAVTAPRSRWLGIQTADEIPADDTTFISVESFASPRPA